MTEQDTFNRLKRIPFSNMDDIILKGFYIAEPGSWPRVATQLYKRHGWTEEEFIKEYLRKQNEV